MEKIQNIKNEIMSSLKKLHFVKSITLLGRYYKNLKRDLTTVNDIDVHIYVDARNNNSCDILLSRCNNVVKKLGNIEDKIIVGIFDGPYKPTELKDRRTFLFHLIVDDVLTIQNRKKTSFPTLISWSKYKPFYGNNLIKPQIDRRITKSDILLSRFGIKNCINFIENEYISMEYFNIVKKKYQVLKYKLSGYYFFYFLFYSLMQSLRNYLRLLQINIEFKSDIETVNIFIENSTIVNSSALLEIVNEMINIRKKGFIKSNIDVIYYKQRILKILKEIKLKIVEGYE